MSVPVSMPMGLTAFLLPLGPRMWHEFALGLDFRDPLATIDLLLAAHAVTTQPECDRATAMMILAKAVQSGLHRGEAPAVIDAEVARAFVAHLSAALIAGRFAAADLALPLSALRLVERELGPDGPWPVPAVALGRQPHHPPFGFAGWRPVHHPEHLSQRPPLAA